MSGTGRIGTLKLIYVAAVAAALGACGTTGRAGDGGLPFGGDGGRTDGGTVRLDGGARTDGGPRTDGGASDGGSLGCTSNSNCLLAQKCNTTTHVCEADPGGVGTDCPGGNADCAQDGMTFCAEGLPNMPTPACTRPCTANSQCPRDPGGTSWTCQAAFTDGDGGIISACLPPDALGTPCRNETTGGEVDPVWECTVVGQLCLPSSQTSPTGNCVAGDGCNFAAQTGCSGTQTCHPAGVFNFDNNQGTFCAPSGSGGQGAACTTLSNCAKGYVCAGEVGCLKYCIPAADGGAGTGCSGVLGADGGATTCIDILTDANGDPLPDAVRSIPAGVCF
jgi:hypothetical protein